MTKTTGTWVVGNWKMHGLYASGGKLAHAVATHAEAHAKPGVEVVICPPATLLYPMHLAIKHSNVKLGAQDCHSQREGAYTGELSANMLKDIGCAYVILGHSERRTQHGETDAMVKQKAEAALQAGLQVILCVGESLEERTQGKAHEVVERQVVASAPKGEFLVAYGPVWAIGTGQTPTGDDIAQMHTYIMGLLEGRCPVIYGGSVKAANARDILRMEGVSGLLVGGASLVAEEFCSIIDAAN